MARWYRQDGNSDSNPKMIRAGFWGTVVFQALCRVSADHELAGEIPAEYADPEYLARRLRLLEDPALAPLWATGTTPIDLLRDGVTRCRHNRLVSDADDGGLIISGWPDRNEEGSSSTVRMRKKREKDRLAKLNTPQRDVTGDGVTSRDSTDVRTYVRTDGGAGGTESPAAVAAPPAVPPVKRRTPKPATDQKLVELVQLYESRRHPSLKAATSPPNLTGPMASHLREIPLEGPDSWASRIDRMNASPFCRGERGDRGPVGIAFLLRRPGDIANGEYDDGNRRRSAPIDEPPLRNLQHRGVR